jgi:outer membrane protein OmpA-like peptidoglycan-associated protein
MARIKTMTGFPGILRITAIMAALLMTAGLALAADNNASADQIVNALQPKALTRSLSADRPADASVQAREDGFVDSVRNRKTRSLSLGEREEIAELATAKPKIDLDIQFEYNSARISQASLPAVQELGKALSTPELKGSTFVVAGHTDAIGGDAFNQDLSDQAVSHREIRHCWCRSRHRRLWQKQAEGPDRAGVRRQSPRSGRQPQQQNSLEVSDLKAPACLRRQTVASRSPAIFDPQV